MKESHEGSLPPDLKRVIRRKPTHQVLVDLEADGVRNLLSDTRAQFVAMIPDRCFNQMSYQNQPTPHNANDHRGLDLTRLSIAGSIKTRLRQFSELGLPQLRDIYPD